MKYRHFAFLALTLLAACNLKTNSTNPNLERSISLKDVQSRSAYLQNGSSSAMTIRWWTSVPEIGRVRFGNSVDAQNSFVDELMATREHNVRLTGLEADSKYYYSVGTIERVIEGGDTTHFFYTFSKPDSTKPLRVWILGDPGYYASAGQIAVRDAYFKYVNQTGKKTDLWIALGDNAYQTGTDYEYQAYFFEVYTSLLKQVPVFLARGNHEFDYQRGSLTFYNLFTFPEDGEAGGVPSHTPAYYSFNFGNTHFICLDSFKTDRSPQGKMAAWLSEDLRQSKSKWNIAYWHHPPYSKGSHDSDTESNMIEMRENILPILEAGGVDLVLTGHSHNYERSFLIDGHYRDSRTFHSMMIKDHGSGTETTSSHPYLKPAIAQKFHSGTVYVVAGTASIIVDGPLNHPAMYYSTSTLGSGVLDISGDRLDFKFLDSDGTIRDSFSIVKSAESLSSSQSTVGPSNKAQ